jgi:hypothetical protein
MRAVTLAELIGTRNEGPLAGAFFIGEPRMSHLTGTNGAGSPDKAIVLFGLSDDGKPQAGLFSEAQAALAKKAAKQLGLTALTVSTTDLAAIKGKIPTGRLYANRRSFIPAARRDVHQKLLEFARATGAGAKGQGSASDGKPPSPPAGFPKDWDSIEPGHQVLAQASLAEGWWETIVVAREGDMLTLKWRDYPREPQFRMHRTQVALQQPPVVATT